MEGTAPSIDRGPSSIDRGPSRPSRPLFGGTATEFTPPRAAPRDPINHDSDLPLIIRIFCSSYQSQKSSASLLQRTSTMARPTKPIIAVRNVHPYNAANFVDW
jgi:hypothetical protein